jgi:hypothetical protein
MLRTGDCIICFNSFRILTVPCVPKYREKNRQAEIKELTSRGIIPHYHELEKHPEKSLEGR